jgi:putative FmdB family regulatory protein
VPTYQYACTACDERLEIVQKFTDDPLTVCDACGGKLRKVFSPVGIVFKGSGFYRNDSRSGAAVGAKDKPADVSANGSSATGEGSASAGSGSVSGEKSGSAEKSGSGESSASAEGKPAKKKEKTGTGSSAGTGSKVA